MSKEDITTKFRVDISDLKAAMQEVNYVMKKANSEFKMATSGMDKWASTTDGVNAKIKQLTTVLDAQKRKLEVLKEEYSSVAKEQGQDSKAAHDLEIKINNQRATINKTEKSLNGYKDELSKLSNQSKYTKEEIAELNGAMVDMAEKASKHVIKGIAKVAVSLAGVAVASAKVGADFDSGMSKVQAISGATADDMEKLRAKAKEMGEKTKFSATEAAEAMQYMAMAGWETSDMLGAIDGVMNLAAASGEDLASVSDIVTDSMTAFGLSADGTKKALGADGLTKEVSNAAYFSDVLAAAASSSNTSVAKMGETFKYAAPVAGALGYSVEDVAIATGLMANAGIKGTQAGTALRATLSRLSKPTEETQIAMDALGISLTDENGKMKSLYAVMNDMRVGFKGLTQDQQASYAAMLGGQEAMSGLLSIVNASQGDFDNLTKSIRESNGASEEMARIMQDNLAGSMTIAKSSVEGVAIKISEILKGPLKKAADQAILLINNFSKSLDNPKTKASLEKLAEGFGNLIVNLIKLATKAIPPTLDGMAWMIDHGDALIPIITALATAILIYKTKTDLANKSAKEMNAITLLVKAGMVAWNTIMKIHNGEMDVAIVKTKLLSMAQSAMPWALAAAGVGLVVGALISFIAKEDDATSEIDENTQAVRENVESWKGMVEAKDEAIGAAISETQYLQDLKEELKANADENGKVKAGYEARANFIITKLNDALGTEIKMVNGVVQSYKEQMDTLDALIAKQRAKAIIDAGQSAYEEAIKNQTSALKEQQIARDQLLQKEEEFEKKLEESMRNGVSKEMATAALLETELGKQYKAMKDNYDAKTSLVEGYTETIAQQEYLQKLYAQGTAEDLDAINQYIAASYDDKGKKVVLSTQEQVENEERLLEYLTGRYQETGNQMYQDQIQQSKVRLQNLKSSLENEKNTVDEKRPEIIASYDNTLFGMVTSVVSKRPEFKKAAESNADAIKEGAENRVSLIQYIGKKLGIAMKAGAEEGSSGSGTIGTMFVQGIENAIKGKIRRITEVGIQLADSLSKTVNKRLDINSPSRVGEYTGEMYDEGIAKGVKSRTKSVIDEGRNMISGLINTTKGKLESAKDNMQALDIGLVSQSSPESNIQGKTINYYQYITSPKATDRMEIRRHTKNLLKMVGDR